MKALTFNPTISRADRALQAWQILVGNAIRGEITTYHKLSQQMFRHPAQGVLAGILGCIAWWCSDHELPILTTLVVNSTTGECGDGLPLKGGIHEERMRVLDTDWYDIVPPSAFELETALNRHS